MNEDHRIALLSTRIKNYADVMRTTIFTLAAIGIGTQIADGYNAALLMLAIAVTVYGVLAGGSALDDMQALRQDMSDEVANSNYGKIVNSRNIPMLKTISSVMLCLSGLAAVLAVLF